jgi:hypothetical protein
MSSPIQVPYKSFVQIDRQSGTAIYLQIAHQLINAIQRGFLVTGHPPSRYPAFQQTAGSKQEYHCGGV